MRSKPSVSTPQIDRNYTEIRCTESHNTTISKDFPAQEIEQIEPYTVIIYRYVIRRGKRGAAVAADTAKFIGASVGFLVAHLVIIVGTVGYFIIILIVEIIVGILSSFRTAEREQAVSNQIKRKQHKRSSRTGNNIHVEGDLNAPNSTFNFYN